MKDQTKYRVYRYSINILGFHLDGISKTYVIKDDQNPILPGLKYSLVTIILGWWSLDFFNLFRFRFSNPFKSWKNAIEALDNNFSGGEDLTKIVIAKNFDRKTNIVYANVVRETHAKIKIDDLEIVIELFDEYSKTNTDAFSEEAIQYILEKLGTININYLDKKDIRNVFDAIQNYNENFNKRASR